LGIPWASAREISAIFQVGPCRIRSGEEDKSIVVDVDKFSVKEFLRDNVIRSSPMKVGGILLSSISCYSLFEVDEFYSVVLCLRIPSRISMESVMWIMR